MEYRLNIENSTSERWKRGVRVFKNGIQVFDKVFESEDDPNELLHLNVDGGDLIRVAKYVVGIDSLLNVEDYVEWKVEFVTSDIDICWFGGVKKTRAYKVQGPIKVIK